MNVLFPSLFREFLGNVWWSLGNSLNFQKHPVAGKTLFPAFSSAGFLHLLLPPKVYLLASVTGGVPKGQSLLFRPSFSLKALLWEVPSAKSNSNYSLLFWIFVEKEKVWMIQTFRSLRILAWTLQPLFLESNGLDHFQSTILMPRVSILKLMTL